MLLRVAKEFGFKVRTLQHVLEGYKVADELAAARPVLSRLGVRSAEVLRVGHDRVVSATTVVRVVIGGRGREEQAGAHHSRRGVA